MRNILLLFTLSIGLHLNAQTDSLEKVLIYDAFLSENMSLERYQKIGKKWNKKKSTYPILSFNKKGEIEYIFTQEFENIDKKILFNRVQEWLSIQYGLIPAFAYSNMDDGKIICANTMDINVSTTCSYTYIFSISDDKIIMECLNYDYLQEHDGYYSGEQWISAYSVNQSVENIFPIILKSYHRWPFYFTLLNSIDNQSHSDFSNLYDYVTTFDSKYQKETPYDLE